jgi:hypothetical protein
MAFTISKVQTNGSHRSSKSSYYVVAGFENFVVYQPHMMLSFVLIPSRN